MKTLLMNVPLEGQYYNCEVQTFYEEDDQTLNDIYKDWRALSLKLIDLGARGINMPEGLSEPVFCRAMGTVRVIKVYGTQGSFDAYCLKTNKRIQVKACSVLPDLTSFGPKSVWDDLYFMDFYREGKWDGSVDIYHVPNDLIYNHNVNVGQTMKDQQDQSRRPRFSIYKEILKKNGIKPIMTYNITTLTPSPQIQIIVK